MERTRQDVMQTLAELRVASGRPPEQPLPAELHAQLLETSTRARFIVDSLRSLADAQESNDFREQTMHKLSQRRLVVQ